MPSTSCPLRREVALLSPVFTSCGVMETMEPGSETVCVDDDKLLEMDGSKGSQTTPFDEDELLVLRGEKAAESGSIEETDDHLDFNASDFDEGEDEEDEEELLVIEEEEDDEGYGEDQLEDESVIATRRPYQRNSSKAVYNGNLYHSIFSNPVST